MIDELQKNREAVMQGQRPGQQTHEHDEGASTPPSEKAVMHLDEDPDLSKLGAAALTDEYGRPIVHLDPKAEARLVWKLDLYVVPTVAVLYLFCFIDVRVSTVERESPQT